MIPINQIKKLREETAASVSDCKKALEEAKGGLDEAKKLLRKWGKELAGKRSGKETSQGVIDSYIHPNKKVGVILELSCETDFVAKSPDFQKLAHELCLQIAAMDDDPPLLEQPWIKDEQKTVKDLIDECVVKVGEKIILKRFERYEI
jgi:elongation factor Ts